MKHYFKRTVVVLNNLEKIDNLLKKAIAFSSQHQTTLEILYVQEKSLFEMPDYFLSEDKMAKGQIDKEKIKAKIQEHLNRLDEVETHAILVYIDDTVDRAMQHAKGDKETLLLTHYHPKITEQLLEKTPYSLFVIKNETENYSDIILPIDLRKKSREALTVAKEIFPKKAITLIHDYRYLLDMLTIQVDYFNLAPIVTPDLIDLNQKIKNDQRESFNTYKKEFNLEGIFLEDDGGSLDNTLIDYISSNNFDLTLLYHQDTELFLSPSLIEELMKKLSTDFFILNL